MVGVAERVDNSVEAVEEAEMTVEEVVAVLVVAEEAKKFSVIAAAKGAIFDPSVLRRTVFVTSVSRQVICNRCVEVTSQEMAVTREEAPDGILEGAPVVDLVEVAHGEEANRRLANLIKCIAKL